MCAAYWYVLLSRKDEEPVFTSKKRPSLFVSSHFSSEASILRRGLTRLRGRNAFSMAETTSQFIRNQLRDDIRSVFDRSYREEHSGESTLDCEPAEYIRQCLDMLAPFIDSSGLEYLSNLPRVLQPADEPIVWWTPGTFVYFVLQCTDLAVESQLQDWLQLLKYLGQLGIDVKKYDGLEDIAYSTSMFFPFKDLCILVDNPVGISKDRQGRLHNESEKAYRFKSGWGICAWHGVHVPQFAIMPVESWSVQMIDHANMEARRLLIEKYGTARFLQDTNAELIQEDEWGQLYRKDLKYDEPLVMVRLTDKTAGPNGYRQYFLRVPPNMTTAKEAVAWSFEMSVDDYKPIKET